MPQGRAEGERPAPGITVLVANYNGSATLGRAIASALRQTLDRPRYEILVADDGSSDSSLEVLQGFKTAVRTLKLPHEGLPRACNAGIRAAGGEYLLRLDSDDELEPSALEDLSRALDADSGTGFVTADRTEVDAATGSARPVRVDPSNMYDLIAPGAMFRVRALLDAGLYDALYWEEYDLFLRLLLKHRSRHLPKSLYRYWRHAGSMTASAERRREGWARLLEKWGIEDLRRFGRCPELEEVHASRCRAQAA